MHDPELGSGPSQTPAQTDQEGTGDKGRRTSSPYRQNSGRHFNGQRPKNRDARNAPDKRRHPNTKNFARPRHEQGTAVTPDTDAENTGEQNVKSPVQIEQEARETRREPNADFERRGPRNEERNHENRREPNADFERRGPRNEERNHENRREPNADFERRGPRNEERNHEHRRERNPEFERRGPRSDKTPDERQGKPHTIDAQDGRERGENKTPQRSQRSQNPSCMRPCAAELTPPKEERGTTRFGSRHAANIGGKRGGATREPPKHSDGRPIRQAFNGQAHLYEVIQVRLARTQRLVEVNTCGQRLGPNTPVLIRVHRNILLATTVGYRFRRVAEINSLPFVIRVASEEDKAVDAQNAIIEKRAHELASNYAIDQNLQMKVLSADLSHDHKNITINFASDVRVDFREMVAYLASQLKLRVEMYQLGLRNGTGLICGLGSCGQLLCCGRFLGQFDPIAVKQLRAQGLATNPKRISGVCGRLYCCMSYEYCDYMKERRTLPKKGRRVFTRWGIGRITDTDTLREELVVTYENGESQRITVHDFVPVTDEIVAKIEAGAYEFPLEPAKFYLNRDPNAACEVETQTKTRVAKKPSSSPRVKRVETTSSVRRRMTRVTTAPEEPSETDRIETVAQAETSETKNIKRRTLTKPRLNGEAPATVPESPLARMPRKVKARQANLEESMMQKAEAKNDLSHPIRRRSIAPNRGKR